MLAMNKKFKVYFVVRSLWLNTYAVMWTPIFDYGSMLLVMFTGSIKARCDNLNPFCNTFWNQFNTKLTICTQVRKSKLNVAIIKLVEDVNTFDCKGLRIKRQFRNIMQTMIRIKFCNWRWLTSGSNEGASVPFYQNLLVVVVCKTSV